MAVEGVLVEYESISDNEVYTNSGMLFSNRYVLITSNVLVPYFRQVNLDMWLKKLKRGLNFNVIPPSIEQHMKIIINENNTELKFKQAQVLAAFVCKNLLDSSQKYLKDWAIDCEEKQHQVKEFFSLFFILEIVDDQSAPKNENNPKDENSFLDAALGTLLENAENFELTVGQDVFIESTPFGNRAFVNSYSQGVVSNLTGVNSCFLLTDCPSAPGSEGSPVFIKTNCKNKFAVGIVISCLNWWKGEWVGLTLAANLVPLLSQLISKNSKKNTILKNPTSSGFAISKELMDAATKSLVQVVCGSGWGTGILLDKDKGVFLTNSHVIETKDNVVLHWKNRQMRASVVYRTPNFDVYDLAVLQCNPNCTRKLDMVQTKISTNGAEIGEEVFAAGYPLFSRDLKPNPSLSRGHVSQVHPSMIKTTCNVLPGASGGAIFRPNGQLLAIIVSNTKMENIGVVYPRVNMTIPVFAIHSIITAYLQTGDSSHLTALHCDNPTLCSPWNWFSGKL